MASYVAMLRDIDRSEQRVKCSVYCIFSNYDDSRMGADGPAESPESSETAASAETPPSSDTSGSPPAKHTSGDPFAVSMRIDGEAETELRAARTEEEQKLKERIEAAYRGEPATIAIRRIRP